MAGAGPALFPEPKPGQGSEVGIERLGTEGEVVALAEETLHVETEQVVTGRIRIETIVDAVQTLATLSLATDRVEITRHLVGRDVSAVPEIRTEGDVTIIPILEEIMVVEKRLVLKEELHVRRLVAHETVEVPVTLRQQRAVVERVSADRDGRGNEES